jgi:hypothetical protein
MSPYLDPLQNIDQRGAAFCGCPITCSLEGHAMQTRRTNWFDAQEGFGAIRLDTVTAILSIFAIVAGVTAIITAFANMQMGNVG